MYRLPMASLFNLTLIHFIFYTVVFLAVFFPNLNPQKNPTQIFVFTLTVTSFSGYIYMENLGIKILNISHSARLTWAASAQTVSNPIVSCVWGKGLAGKQYRK